MSLRTHRTYRVALPALSAVAVLALAGCDPDELAVPEGTPGAGANDGAQSAEGFGASPLDNPDGTKPGLAPLTSDADRAEARKVIDKVLTKGRGPKTGYDRDEFGSAWKDSVNGIALARNGCDTRNDLLKRDGQKVRYRSGSDCVVASLTLKDPYTGGTIAWTKAKATKIQIDHVMPLSYDWQMGASRWSDAKRQQIANDPLNLIPVDGPTNGSKSDSGPATWLPPYKPIRCSYALRFAQVSLKYELPVTTADKAMMLKQCAS
ncbi:HNH endonuclease family protein [Streptomyces sp. NBC_01218]|uniref:HNH endonuclease family protein n=1 Tax=unclassified Streptomyces TaxID=2593676 RepID=UPI0023B96B1C|nr:MULTISPECIES: HNH endonuclease family protein [unclassified Streptomyces]WEH40152.1 HNH endonuclease family protein [Streptomyces sp. AM 2-1-1]WSQ51845.1 HNH endonuclease family protein [Streptomyces sp. NBC_01218]